LSRPLFGQNTDAAAISPVANPSIDAAGILAAIGEAAFVWEIEHGNLIWSANAPQVLKGVPAATLGNAAEYSRLAAAGKNLSRYDVIARAVLRDQGAGVAYQLQYELNAQSSPIKVEEIGRGYAGRDGKPIRAIGLVRVVTERHEIEKRLVQLSQFDGLTGELNRASLLAELERAVEEAKRDRTSLGFMLIAVDHLARINEAFGHNAADEVIAEVARRFRARLRLGDVMGRFSGNKLAVILRDCTREKMEAAADRFLALARDEAIHTSAGSVAITVSAGGIIAPRHARNARDVMGRAQEALDTAKQRWKGHFWSWRPSVEIETRRLKNIRATDEIVRALNERRIEVAFEPVVDAATLKPAFYESLLRVRRQNGELLSAQEVVPIAEKLGLIRLLDHQMLRLVIEQLALAPGVTLSVNISPDTTTDPDWWANLEGLLRTHPEISGRLIVEITETVAIQDVDEVRGFVSRLKNMGIRIAIDDFGAGFTSFRNLRKLSVDIVKIDGAFIQAMLHSADDRAFTQSLIELAKRLGLQTVAEWVQNEATAALLREWGCTYIQGHHTGIATLERPWPAPRPGDQVQQAASSARVSA
jgi:diguanylate cyclase (GGDEF)-like protein